MTARLTILINTQNANPDDNPDDIADDDLDDKPVVNPEDST
jgi:hypothetical protein